MPSRFIVRLGARAVGMTSARPSRFDLDQHVGGDGLDFGHDELRLSCSISARSAAPSVIAITCERCATCMAGRIRVAIDGDRLDARARCRAMITSLPSSPAPSSMTRTLSHGPLTHLGMPTGMTMVFRVKEAGWLDQMKTGDRIRFVADRVDGVFTVVDFVPAR
jgi:hypothetical protein